MSYSARLRRLKELGLPGRAIADFLGVSESTVSRLLRDEGRAERFFRKEERRRALSALEADPQGLLRRWLFARTKEALRRRYPWIPEDDLEALVLTWLRRRAPGLFS